MPVNYLEVRSAQGAAGIRVRTLPGETPSPILRTSIQTNAGTANEATFVDESQTLHVTVVSLDVGEDMVAAIPVAVDQRWVTGHGWVPFAVPTGPVLARFVARAAAKALDRTEAAIEANMRGACADLGWTVTPAGTGG